MYMNNYDIRQLSYMSRIILEFREKQRLAGLIQKKRREGGGSYINIMTSKLATE